MILLVIGAVLYLLSAGAAAWWIENYTHSYWDDPGALLAAALWPVAGWLALGYALASWLYSEWPWFQVRIPPHWWM